MTATPQAGRKRRAARAVALLAGHEVRRVFSAFRRPSTLAGLIIALVLLAALVPVAIERGIRPDQGLYPITVHPDSPFADAIASDPRFEVIAAGEGADGAHGLDGVAVLEAGRDEVRYAPTAAGRAAYRELVEALRQWQEARLESEADEGAAFPVEVNLIMAVRDPAATAAPPPSNGGSERPPSLLDQVAPEAASSQVDLRPSEVEPPFPVRSLLLTFAFLIPMNFVAQLYAGTLLADRARHRALLGLTTPYAPGTLLLGRSMPYLLAGLMVLAAAGILTGAGWQGWLAALPVIAFVLAASLFLGLLARNERELTFLLTGATTMLAVFLFLPAVFTAVPAVAFLSPVSVIVASIQGEAVGWRLFVYATLPLILCTLAITAAGTALYREETLFSQRRPRDRILAGLARRLTSPLRTVAAGALVVPFAFVLELLVLSLAIPLGWEAALPVTLVGVVLVEERLKLAVAAARRRQTGDPAWRGAVWAGIGFFVGEKLALVLALVGFGFLTLGEETLRVFGVSGGWLLLVAPLLLHVACSVLAAAGLGRARPWPTVLYFAAAALHLAYNLAVLWMGGAS